MNTIKLKTDMQELNLVSTHFYVHICLCPGLQHNALLTVFINQFLF